MKKFFYILLVIMLCMTTLSIPSSKIVAATSGKIGEKVTFQYSSSTKTLTIKGSGAINQDDIFDAPWDEYREEIKTIVVEEGITVVPDYTFMDLVNVTKVTLPKTLTSIGWYAFCDCESLTKLFIPKSVKNITRGAFNGCTSLKEFTVSQYNDYFKAIDGVLFSKDMKTLKQYPPAKTGSTYTIPSGVVEVYDYAFVDNQYIKTLKMANTVTTFLDCSCQDMQALETIKFSDNVKYLYSNAFAYNYQLKNVVIPKSVESVGEHCFYADKNLGTITFKSKNTYVGYFKDNYPSQTIICGYADSKAQNYAKRTGKDFKNLETGKVSIYFKDNQTLMDELPTSGLNAGEPTYHNVHMQTYAGVFSGYQTFILHEEDTTNEYYKEIKAKVTSLCKGLSSDYAKAKAIMKFVHNHIEYDMGYLGNSVEAVYRAWVNKKGSCESYTVLNNYMLFLAGIPVATITSSAHEWSAALIDGEWITIDATNGEFDIEPNQQPNINAISYSSKKGVYLMDGYNGITLAGIGYAYNTYWRKQFSSFSVPSSVNNIHASVFDCTKDDFKLKGKKDSKAHKAAIREGFCVTSDDTYFYAKEKHPSTKTKTTKATSSKDGKIDTICTTCNAITSTQKIAKVSDISLSSKNFTYNGEVKTPTVTVRDSNGKKISSSNYTITYSSVRKNVGKYCATITFKGKYSGKVKKSFTIKPQGTTIKALTTTTNKNKVNITRRATQTSGYELQYATSKSFSDGKTIIINDPYILTKTISNLKSGKKYYVRIRTYKKVTVSGEATKIYSAYSDAKTIVVK